jgi:hypothetical protein
MGFSGCVKIFYSVKKTALAVLALDDHFIKKTIRYK